MQYRLLGGVEVRDDGANAVDLGPRKQRAVLAVLLLEVGRVVPSDRLVELLWGDDAPKAHMSLQSYVSHLRRALEPERGPRSTASVLVTRPPGYALMVDRGDVDVYRFEDLVAEGRELLRAGDPHGARTVLGRALAEWTGAPMPELAGEPFATGAIDRFERIRLSALEAAAEAALQLGDPHGALALLDPQVAAHPLREHLHALVALSLYRTGRQADALRAVDACRRALADAAGLDPGPELKKLEADLLAQSPSLDWTPHPPPAQPAEQTVDRSSVPGGAPVRGGRGSDLVGRRTEFAVLVDALTAAAEGRGGIAVVTGEPGIGKTRLVEELAALARDRGVVTAWARCPEVGAPSYWPATQLGDQLRAAGVITARLVAGDDHGDDTEGVRARFALHRGIVELVRSIELPLLFVIDDLQWADPDSLRLVEQIAADLSATRALLVTTTRPLGDAAPRGLVDCLAEIARAPSSVQLRLEGLDADEVTEWLARRVESTVPAEVAAIVHDRTDGNPLFVKELVELLAGEGRLTDAASVRSARAIPPGVHFVVRRRVSQLPAASQQLLTVAAVVGRSFDIGIVAAASDCDDLAVLDAMTPALAAGLLLDDGGGLRFSHALVADALADEVNAATRARIHAAAARAIASRYGDDLGTAAAVVAHHAMEGMLAGTGELAVAASTAAAQLAVGRYADEDAAMHWRGVARALRRTRPGDARAIVAALTEEARALLRADLVGAAKEPVLEGIDAAGAAGLVEEMAVCASLLNHAHVWTNEAYGVVDQRVVAALERTLAAIPADDLARRADVLGALAGELVFGEASRHRAVCAAAIDAARAAGDPLVLARVLVDVALPNRAGELDDREARAAEIVALVQEHALQFDIAFAGWFQVAFTRLERGDLAGAAAALASARDTVEGVPGTKFRSQLQWFEATLAFAHGRYDEARARFRSANDAHRRARGYDADSLQMTGEITFALDTGGFEELVATTTFDAASTPYARMSMETLAFCFAEVGDVATARRVVEMIPPTTGFNDDWTMVLTMTTALHVRAAIGDVAAVEELIAALGPFTGRWASGGTAPLTMGLVDFALARGEAAAGRLDTALPLFVTAVEGHARIGAPVWLARTLVAQASALRTSSEPAHHAEARDALARAADLADRYGLVYVRRAVDGAMARA